jgi:hypothetical protein
MAFRPCGFFLIAEISRTINPKYIFAGQGIEETFGFWPLTLFRLLFIMWFRFSPGAAAANRRYAGVENKPVSD